MSSIHYNTFKTLWWYYLFFKIYQDTQINSWNISNIIMGFKKGLWRIQFKSYLPIIEEIEFTFFFDSDPYLVFWLKEFCNYYILNWVIAMQNGFFWSQFWSRWGLVYIKVKFAWLNNIIFLNIAYIIVG